jgi:hypothetical protein
VFLRAQGDRAAVRVEIEPGAGGVRVPDAQDRQRLALRTASIVVVVFVNPRGLRDRHIRHGLARDVHHDVVVEFREGPAFGIIEPDFKDSGAYTPKWQPPAFGPTPSDLARFVIGLQRPIVGAPPIPYSHSP